ncbi:MAG TPA: hypothetical protein VEZ55_01280 [Chitinophagaceae bacterium]|nr:hypothetical protein [Chitinophagaceae bacterium]
MILSSSFGLTSVAFGQSGAKNNDNTFRDDVVTVAASRKYIPHSFLRRVIMGNNYRREWAEPVTVPVFRLQKSGLIIKELGGGMQTKSLSLMDRQNREWVLRSVDKDARGALPKNIRNGFTIKVVQDMISAAHPYGALVVGQLAESAGIVAPKPTLYFIPDDPAFGEHQRTFANMLCFLEQKEPTPDRSDAQDTHEVLKELVAENDHLVLQKKVLKARLLDMLVADWDRHADQWKWGTVPKEGTTYYYAIPRDRDQAFFRSGGLLPRLAKAFGMRHINWFKEESRGIKQLSVKSWKFDKIFLNELGAAEWKQTITEFQNSLSDTAIQKAVSRLPGEVYAISGNELASRLISRRNTLMENALKYYRFIASTVDIAGSSEDELFTVTGLGESITITVHRYDGAVKGTKIYERSFDPSETGIVYLNGLEGNDRFVVEEGSGSKIKIKIKGGDGADSYDLKGKFKVEVDDTTTDTDLQRQVKTAKSRSKG